MKRLALFALMLVAALAAQEPPAEKPPAEKPTVREIVLQAKKYDFTPSELRVKQGERVRLIVVALDRKHGIKIEEFGVDRDAEEGAQTVVEFTADKAGTFQFQCAAWCGFGHSRMRGTLIVEPTEKTSEEKPPRD